MSLLVALAAQKNRILPEPVSNAAKLGLEWHYKFGGGKNIGLAKAIASRKALTHEQIEAIADFFETFEPDRKDPGWMNHDNPSPDWILWLLMGGDVACLWSMHYRDGCLHPNPMAYNEPF
ncbi:hypothetical protein [Laspinema sp. D2d]|uniref:hypothetical protein n=1 Tax=Laspinema sp. D2d TaxID=2953686 RepID=UPI0021BAEB52|nr:hypothetical protein [Laspinema sp. D2d]